MFFVRSSAVVALFTYLIISVTGMAIQETNGQRLARGLPPSPPRFGRNLPGRVTGRESTPVWAAKRAAPSGSPTIQLSGRIQARNPENKQSLGNVRNWNGSSSISGLNFLGPDQDLHVSFTAPPSGHGPFDILATNAVFASPFFVGASVSQFGSGTIGQGLRDTVAFTNVEQTPPGSPPVKSTSGDNSLGESAIWSFNPGTKELKAQYINPDGSQPTTVIAYDIRANGLFFVGDIDAYNQDNNTPASAVELFLVPI